MKKHAVRITTLIFFVVLVFIGTLLDLSFNEHVDGYFPYFSRFFEIFGEVPLLIMGVISFSILAATRGKKYKISSALQLCIFSLLGTLVSFLGVFMIMGYLAKDGAYGDSHGQISNTMMVVAVILAIIIYIISYLIASRTKEENVRYYRRIAIFGIVFFFATLIFVNVIKTVWGRPRYWSVIQGDSEFVPWYIINGPAPSNEFKSFISGHTANAFTMIYFSLFAIKKELREQQFYILGIIWGLLVAASRLFIGQHFITDVVFSGIFVLALFEILYKVFKINSFKS